jgi:hypothetical protein
MRTPDPPYLELGFYFRQKSGREAIRCLATALTTHFDAVPTNAYAADLAARSLYRADEVVDHQVKTPSHDDLNRLLNDSSRFVRRISLDKGTRIVRDSQEFLVVLPIERPECKNEGNAVAIWVEGALFSRASNTEVSKKEKQVAINALTAFKKLVTLVQPTYAAITVDYGLENPCDLRRDSHSLAFRDFYLSRSDFGEDFLRTLRTKFPNSIYSENEGGQITITTTAFRVAAGYDSVGDDGFDLSEFMGKSIGRMMN